MASSKNIKEEESTPSVLISAPEPSTFAASRQRREANDPSVLRRPAHPRPSRRDDFRVAIICALPIEYNAICLLVDQFWDQDGKGYGHAPGDANLYKTGRIGKHNVVLMLLPGMGKTAITSCAASLRSSYPDIQLGLLVGVCAGVPISGTREVLLGDVIISEAIVQHDFGRQYPNRFVVKHAIEDVPGRPTKSIRNLIAYLKTELGHRNLQQNTEIYLQHIQKLAVAEGYRCSYHYPGPTEDRLFPPDYQHKHHGLPPCELCEIQPDGFCTEAAHASCADLGCEDGQLISRTRLRSKLNMESADAQAPEIFIGRVASGDMVVKSGEFRDAIAREHNIIAFEMEGAGAWDEIPCIVVKGACDYADSHKSKIWQPFAAATAAAAAKAVLEQCFVADSSSKEELSESTTEQERGRFRYAKDLVQSLEDGTEPYWKHLHNLVGRIPSQFRSTYISTTDLHTNLYAEQRAFGPGWGPKNIQPELVERADQISSRLNATMEKVKATLIDNRLGLPFMTVLRGAVLSCMRFGLKREAYFRSIASGMELAVDYMNFLGTHTLSPFSDMPGIRALYLNAYEHLLFVCQQIKDFFLDDFGNEVPLSPDTRWESRWQTVKHSLAAFQEVIAADTAFAVELKRHHYLNHSEELRDMERDRSLVMDLLARMNEETERLRLETRRKILLWVSELEYHSAQETLFSTRLEGTGLWLLHREEFIHWFNTKDSSILWCWGSPGIGKTILCSIVQDFISRSFKNVRDVGHAFVYCSFREPRPPEQYLLSYLRQFLSQLPFLPTGILERYYDLCQSARQLALSDLEVPAGLDASLASRYTNLFTYVIERFERVHITFDALDECDDREKWFLPYICRLVQRYRDLPSLGVTIKIFVTSRRHKDIERAFFTVPTIQILAKNVDSDINAFIKHELSRRFDNGTIGTVHMRLQKHITNSLTSRAEGMFLWVKYQLDDICEQFTSDGVISTLDQLPETLHGHYDRLLASIDSQSKAVRTMAKAALKCITGCFRRLGGDELLAAISFVAGQNNRFSPHRDHIDVKQLVNACHNLLVIAPDRSVGFTHYSVLEYFVSDHLRDSANPRLRDYRIDVDEEHFQIAIACLTCLANLNKNGRRGPFDSYAKTYRAMHLQSADPRRLADPPFITIFTRSFQPLRHGILDRESSTPVQLAAQLGLYNLLNSLLESRQYAGMSELEGALRLCHNGDGSSNDECRRLLIEKGVHIGAASPLIGMCEPLSLQDEDNTHWESAVDSYQPSPARRQADRGQQLGVLALQVSNQVWPKVDIVNETSEHSRSYVEDPSMVEAGRSGSETSGRHWSERIRRLVTRNNR